MGLATAFSVALMAVGSYSIFKDNSLKGGLYHIIAGIITTGIYLITPLGISTFFSNSV